jgi:hypothetical protein
MGFSYFPPWRLSEGGSDPPLDGLLYEVKLASQNKRGRPRASLFPSWLFLSCEPVTVLDSGAGFAAIPECRYPRSPA